jgi:Ca2+/Na+ antiporter
VSCSSGALASCSSSCTRYAQREKGTPEKEETWQQAKHIAAQAPAPASTARCLLALLGGLVLLVLAAQVLIAPVSVLAHTMGISPYIIGLTVIGIGTSLPEIAASIQAARTGHIDLVLGNVFGSNVFNICIGLGLPMIVKPIRVVRRIVVMYPYNQAKLAPNPATGLPNQTHARVWYPGAIEGA